MGILADVVTLARDLAGRGWGPTFQAHGIDLSALDDEGDLTAERPAINRERPGFEDFALGGARLLEPGDLAKSLLYHALAHPGVHPTEDGKPPEEGQNRAHDYPSLSELELVENAVYALRAGDVRATPGLVAAVFAYQYREATRTPLGLHADVVYARTGIARVGEAACLEDRPTRSFAGLTSDGKFRVRPARFGVFLAEPLKGPDVALVGGLQRGDGGRTFLLPRHKLFDGPECVRGSDVRITWAARHRSEKLRRAVTHGRLRLTPGFDVSRPPFLREGDDDPTLAVRVPVGSTVLIVAPPLPLAEQAVQKNARSGKVEIVRVRVPKQIWPLAQLNRRYTTLHLLGYLLRAALDWVLTRARGRPAYFMPRRMPEFLNMRHQVVDGGKRLVDLSMALASTDEYSTRLKEGGYETALFEDGLSEGCVVATIQGLGPEPVRARPAWSLVTAPDFFPEVDQMDLHRWVEQRKEELSSTFSHGSPEPLCMGRLGVNPALTLPGGRRVRAFHPQERTLVAAYGVPRVGLACPVTPLEVPEPLTSTWLPDAAGNVFAPGWDCTYDGIGFHSFYCAYGLGSPFAEDVKLCAAGAGSWAAVSPDASRTYRRSDTPTAIPLTDDELGLHPRHPRWNGDPPATEARGWDGEYGPFIDVLDQGGRKVAVVNFADIDRSDYVRNVREGTWRPQHLSGLTSTDLIARMDGLRRCVRALGSGSAGSTALWLVSLETVEAWAPDQRPLSPELKGKGHRWIFAETDESDPTPVPAQPPIPHRLRQTVNRFWLCHTDLASDRAFHEAYDPLKA